MQVTVTEDAPVLVPNKEHENFTRTSVVIPAGTTLEGSEKTIKGKRRGEPFDYRLFHTNKNQFIYLKKIQPMKTTQVYLGADADQPTTIVEVPSDTLLTTKTVIGLVAGAYAGYWYNNKYQKGKKYAFMIGGAAAGYIVAHMIEGNGTIKLFKKSGK